MMSSMKEMIDKQREELRILKREITQKTRETEAVSMIFRQTFRPKREGGGSVAQWIAIRTLTN